jgi:hypothetical protein
MASVNGISNNPKGKPKGALSAKTKEWEALGESITNIHTQRFNEILSTLDDDKFADKFLQVLEYFKPKLNRTSIEGTGTPLEIQVVTFK